MNLTKRIRLAKQALAGLVSLSVIFASSCSGFSLNAKDLMSPPEQSKQQEALCSALADAIGTDDFDLRAPSKDPSSGSVFYCDLYGSQEFEAVILYSLESKNDETRVHILTRDKTESWTSLCDFIPSAGSAITSLTFSKVDPTGYSQLLIGSTIYSGRESGLSVWSLDTGKAVSIFSSPFSNMVSFDFDDDSLDELILFNTLADGTGTSVTLLGYNEAQAGIATESTELLDVQFTSWLSVTTGLLDTGSRAVFVDGKTDADTYATEVVAVISGQLVKMFGANVPTRSTPVCCRDVDDNGSIEVPVQEIMPGYAGVAEAERIPCINWSSCGVSGLTVRTSSAVNVKWDYMILFPSSLPNAVTVLSDDDATWTLCQWDAEQQATSRKIVTIRSWISSEWDEKQSLHPEQQLIARRGNICFTAEIYRSDLITAEYLAEAFIFI